jgi:L-iditol 2-dehydrogenase
VRAFSVGDLVLRTTAVYPNEQLGGMSSLLGGLAEYGLATDWAALQQDEPQRVISPWWLPQQKLPADFDALNGGMLITLKELLSWAEQVDVRVGQTVAIVGLGPVGLTLVRICKLLGARVLAVGRRQQRIAMARELGADVVEDGALLATTGGAWIAGRYDLILDTAGDKGILERLPASLNEGGRLAIYSVPAEQRMEIDWTWGGDVPRNWSVVFRVPREQDHHQHALDCLNLGFVDFAPFLTHTFPMEDMDKAWEALSSGQGIKITVKVAS